VNFLKLISVLFFQYVPRPSVAAAGRAAGRVKNPSRQSHVIAATANGHLKEEPQQPQKILEPIMPPPKQVRLRHSHCF
jgi:hypothetical protein